MSIAKLVQKATKAPKDVTDMQAAILVSEDSVLALKTICQEDEKCIDDVARYLLLDLSNRSAIVRLKSLGVIDSLFSRSKIFRKAISSNIRSVAECAGFLNGKRINCEADRELLEHRVKELLELWDNYYGEYFPEIRALTRHMREFLRLTMPNINIRAREHAVALDKKNAVRENKILARARVALSEIKAEGKSSLSLLEISSSLSELNSCFSIIFPGVVEPSAMRNLKENDFKEAISETFIPQSSSGEIVWECDGQEVNNDDDLNNDNDMDDSMESAPIVTDTAAVNNDDDDDDVAWEDASMPNDDFADDEEIEAETVIAPFTLSIMLPMTAMGVATADNAVVLQTLKEISNHLTSFALPTLTKWRGELSLAMGVYNHDNYDDNRSRKRGRDDDVDELQQHSRRSTMPIDDLTSMQEREVISYALREVYALELEVQTVLRTRCSTFLQQPPMPSSPSHTSLSAVESY